MIPEAAVESDTEKMKITEFLEARIAEDEAAASALLDGGKWGAARNEDALEWAVDSNNYGMLVATGYVGNSDSRPMAEHIARHDPARVLAECAAKRAIADEHAAVRDENWMSGKDHDYLFCGSCGSLDDAPVPYPCATLAHLAAVYADHADYQQEWTP